eukprot:scaffold1605_cov141-Cylindrotheca_fusiformis.AAC.15
MSPYVCYYSSDAAEQICWQTSTRDEEDLVTVRNPNFVMRAWSGRVYIKSVQTQGHPGETEIATEKKVAVLSKVSARVLFLWINSFTNDLIFIV